MLPIAQIGNMLSQNQWTEELTHNAEDNCNADDLADFNQPFLPPSGYSDIVPHFSESKALAYIHSSEKIPSNHSTDVVTPPPDSVI